MEDKVDQLRAERLGLYQDGERTFVPYRAKIAQRNVAKVMGYARHLTMPFEEMGEVFYKHGAPRSQLIPNWGERAKSPFLGDAVMCPMSTTLCDPNSYVGMLEWTNALPGLMHEEDPRLMTPTELVAKYREHAIAGAALIEALPVEAQAAFYLRQRLLAQLGPDQFDEQGEPTGLPNIFSRAQLNEYAGRLVCLKQGHTYSEMTETYNRQFTQTMAQVKKAIFVPPVPQDANSGEPLYSLVPRMIWYVVFNDKLENWRAELIVVICKRAPGTKLYVINGAVYEPYVLENEGETGKRYSTFLSRERLGSANQVWKFLDYCRSRGALLLEDSETLGTSGETAEEGDMLVRAICDDLGLVGQMEIWQQPEGGFGTIYDTIFNTQCDEYARMYWLEMMPYSLSFKSTSAIERRGGKISQSSGNLKCALDLLGTRLASSGELQSRAIKKNETHFGWTRVFSGLIDNSKKEIDITMHTKRLLELQNIGELTVRNAILRFQRRQELNKPAEDLAVVLGQRNLAQRREADDGDDDDDDMARFVEAEFEETGKKKRQKQQQ